MSVHPGRLSDYPQKGDDDIPAAPGTAVRPSVKQKQSLKDRARRLKTDVPAVFLALKEKETPWYAKLLAAVTVVYALSPVDLIPDFIPVLGYLDDLLILPALIALTVRCIPPDVFAACRTRAEGLWADGKPKRWYYAIPFVLIWLVVIGLLALLVWRVVA